MNAIVIGLPVILITILYLIIVGEENDRYLIYGIPYFIISFAYLNIFAAIKYLFKS
tara:strand:+ start:1407 stop:1574 length:168 start_codon:yes stop_codon:yes gene_type:complete